MARFGSPALKITPGERREKVVALTQGGVPTKLGFATNRNHTPEGSLTQNYYASRIVKKSGKYPLKGVRLAFPWWSVVSSTSLETNIGNGATVRASIEVGGTRYQIKKGGLSSFSVIDGETTLSDVLLIDIPANTTITVHFNCDTGGASNKLPVNTWGWSAIGDGVETGGNAQTDKTMTGTVTAASSGGTNTYSPIVMGLMPVDAICHFLAGDSITQGSEERKNMTVSGASDSAGNISWIEKLLGSDNNPFCNAGRAGSKAQRWFTAGNMDKRIALMQLVTTPMIAVDALSQNDISGNIGTLRTYLGTINANLKTGGAYKVIGVTNKPYTTSTDGWTTAANQAEVVAGKVAQHNANIRSNPPANQDAYIDLSLAASVSGDETKWDSVGGAWTADGIHFTPFGVNAALPRLSVASLF